MPDTCAYTPPGGSNACISGRKAGLRRISSRRHAARPQDLLLAVHVAEERVERLHALFEPAREPRPLLGVEHARDDVERDQALGVASLGVDRERDAHAPEEQLRAAVAALEIPGRRLREPLLHELVGRAHAGELAHLVEGRAARVEIPAGPDCAPPVRRMSARRAFPGGRSKPHAGQGGSPLHRSRPA